MREDDELDLTLELLHDLVALEYAEPLIRTIVTNRPLEWSAVAKLAEDTAVDLPNPHLVRNVYAAWLPDVLHVPGFVIIVFVDVDSWQSVVAHYNRDRLLRES